MTIYVDSYRRFRQEYYSVKQEQQNILREAVNELKAVYRNLKDLSDIIIITIEGYDCLAYISDNYLPIEIYPTVIPFSYEKKKIYPEQDIKLDYSFIRD